MKIKTDSDGTPMFVTNALIPRNPRKLATFKFVRIRPSRKTMRDFFEGNANCPKCGALLIGSPNPRDPKICSNKDCEGYIQCPECGGEMVPLPSQIGTILKCKHCNHERKT